MRFTLIALVAMFLLLGVAQPEGCGGECCDTPTPTDAGSDAGTVDDASTDAGTADATSNDVTTDDSAVADPCALYEPLDGWQDGWTCDINNGTNTASCGFTLDTVNGICYLWCWDQTTNGIFKCTPPANFAHDSSFSSFACTSLGQDAISCER